MVAGLDLKAHLLQAQTDLPAGALSVVQGAQVKIARLVAGLGGGFSVFIRLEEEKLQFRTGVEREAHVACPAQHPLEHVPRIAHKRRAVGIVDVADEASHLAVLGPPGQYGKCVQIRPQVLVGLLDADKALNGAAVHHDLIVDGLFDLGGGDGHVFHLPENIGELHADELNIFLHHPPDNVFLSEFAHGCAPFPCGGLVY